MKSRKQKAKIYNEKYSNIPKDLQERLNYIIDSNHISTRKMADIVKQKNQMMQAMKYMPEIFVIIYEEPEGSPRPRARYINKQNLSSIAKSSNGFIQIYSLTGASDKKFMKQLITNEDFNYLDSLIYTPCTIKYDAYIKTPKAFNSSEKVLAELGYIRPICKPDFDNIEKKYSDMYTGNIWIDDSLVISSNLNKYYSILPRIEITLKFMNMLYNKYQYKSMENRVENKDEVKFFQYKK